MMILKLILIQIIIVQIIDISDFVQTVKRKIWKWLKGTPYQEFRMKPFDCSYCMNFWISLIYIIFAGYFSLEYMSLILILSWLTPYVKDLQYTIGDLIQLIINKINKALTTE